ncbi:MAG: branched-chain amino acid transporter [Acidimicrobiales bacterium]|nr:branched-chain amino acid transporter [Acidimicrobiales bacterium]
MASSAHIAAIVLVSAGITWALRAVPFAVVGRLNRSDLVKQLSRTMPLGVMLILALYCLRAVDVTTAREPATYAASIAVTVLLHLWRRNPSLSILGGTALHVFLTSL